MAKAEGAEKEEPAAVKFMVTKVDRAALKERGYTDEQIDGLRPEQAQGIIEAGEPEKRGEPTETGFAPALRPSVMYEGKQYDGQVGEAHPDVMKENDISPEAEHERGFVDPDGKFMTRDQAEAWLKENDPETYKKWQAEAGKGAELHSEDLAEAKKEVTDATVQEKAEGDRAGRGGVDERPEAAVSEGVREPGATEKETAKEGAGADVVPKFSPEGYATEGEALAAISNRKLKLADYDVAEREGRYFVEGKDGTRDQSVGLTTGRPQEEGDRGIDKSDKYERSESERAELRPRDAAEVPIETKIVEPFPLTSEWQEVPKDATIEPGADVQMDMTTGKVLAKKEDKDGLDLRRERAEDNASVREPSPTESDKQGDNTPQAEGAKKDVEEME